MSRATTWLRTYYYVWMPFVAISVMFAANIIYTNYVEHRNDQEICDLIRPLDQAYQNPPTPLTGTGLRIANAIHDQFVRRGCTDV
jgi:hypothetical protein